MTSKRMELLARETALDLDRLLDAWGSRVEVAARQAPVGPHVLASIAAALTATRRIVSREVGGGGLKPLPSGAPLPAADAFVLLLRARLALDRWATAHHVTL